jgi:hypothetical protein
MLELNKKDIKKIKFAIYLANNEDYIKKLFKFFGIDKFSAKTINDYFDVQINQGKLNPLRREFIKNYSFFMKRVKTFTIDEIQQKLIFNLAIETKIDELFIQSKEKEKKQQWDKAITKFRKNIDEYVSKRKKSCKL